MYVLLLFLSMQLVQANEIGSVVDGRCSTCSGLNECKTLNGFALPDRIVGYTRYVSPSTDNFDQIFSHIHIISIFSNIDTISNILLFTNIPILQ